MSTHGDECGGVHQRYLGIVTAEAARLKKEKPPKMRVSVGLFIARASGKEEAAASARAGV